MGTTANKPTPVADVQVVMIGGRLYVAGGQLESGAISDQFEAYNPDQDEWQALPKLLGAAQPICGSGGGRQDLSLRRLGWHGLPRRGLDV